MNSPSTQFTITPIVVKTEDLPVKEGVLPLVYMVESDGVVRVTDLTTGQLLGQSAAGRRTLVSVDDRTGVRIADQTLTHGPLPADHHYGIYFNFTDAGGMNQFQTGTERAGARPNPGVLHLNGDSGGPMTRPSSTQPSSP